jgi:hypothetical protein
MEQEMTTTVHPQTDLVKAITEIAKAMPPTRTAQLYEFALFLKSHPLPAEETIEAIAADEAQWDKQFAATSEDKLASLAAEVETEISEGKVWPMFNERGKFVERK